MSKKKRPKKPIRLNVDMGTGISKRATLRPGSRTNDKKSRTSKISKRTSLSEETLEEIKLQDMDIDDSKNLTRTLEIRMTRNIHQK
ncbi:8150_t:CDS:2 [Gigaspora rosea]|nr:8150_t:CDS:2 [Gigaspora rosea]